MGKNGRFCPYLNGGESLITTAALAVSTTLVVVALSRRYGSSERSCAGETFLPHPISTLWGKIRISWLKYRSTDEKTVVTDIVYYPVKSLRRIPVDKATLGPRGFVDDRTYMLVAPAGSLTSTTTHRFLSQRRFPILTRVAATFVDDSTMEISFLGQDGVAPIQIPRQPFPDAPVYSARVWGHTVQVQDMGTVAAEYLQSILVHDANYEDEASAAASGAIRLVRQLDQDQRSPDIVPAAARTLAGSRPRVSLADGFPMYVAMCLFRLPSLLSLIVLYVNTHIYIYSILLLQDSSHPKHPSMTSTSASSPKAAIHCP